MLKKKEVVNMIVLFVSLVEGMRVRVLLVL